MNEIITKLNEIEEKAEAILRDAQVRKEELTAQLERDKQAIDEAQEKRETEMMQKLREELTAEAQEKTRELHRREKEAAEAFEERFAQEKEALAEQILQRVIQ